MTLTDSWPKSKAVLFLPGGIGMPPADHAGKPLYAETSDLATLVRQTELDAQYLHEVNDRSTLGQFTGIEILLGTVFIPWLIGTSSGLFVSALFEFLSEKKPASVKVRVGRETEHGEIEWIDAEGEPGTVVDLVRTFLDRETS